MATINLGRIKPVWQGLWAASTAYVKDDIVRYDVDSYICTASHTSSANFASDSANWDLVAQGATIPSQSGQAGKALITDGTNLSWADAGTVRKIHYITYSSRTACSPNANYDQFQWSQTFTPLDPVNNSFHFHYVVPTNHGGNDWGDHGLRLIGSGGSILDYSREGVQHIDVTGPHMSFEGASFIRGAGTIPAGQTYTIKYRTYEQDSQPDYYCPNTADDSRVGGQTVATLIITEYRNPA
jgi:hypothetical protein